MVASLHTVLGVTKRTVTFPSASLNFTQTSSYPKVSYPKASYPILALTESRWSLSTEVPSFSVLRAFAFENKLLSFLCLLFWDVNLFKSLFPMLQPRSVFFKHLEVIPLRYVIKEYSGPISPFLWEGQRLIPVATLLYVISLPPIMKKRNKLLFLGYDN